MKVWHLNQKCEATTRGKSVFLLSLNSALSYLLEQEKKKEKKKKDTLLTSSPAMGAFSVHASPSPSLSAVYSINTLPSFPLLKPFLHFKPLQRFHLNNRSYFTTPYEFSTSVLPIGSSSQLSDDEIEAESDEDDEDDVAAEEYDAVSAEIGEDSEQDEDEEEEEEDDENDDVVEGSGVIGENINASGSQSRYEEFKWQRVERIRNEVREFGEEIIDVEELASVYDFRIDKFQVFSAVASFMNKIYGWLCEASNLSISSRL